MAMGLEEHDGVTRLARAGEYWRVHVGVDERFAFGQEHTRTKYVIVQRDVIEAEHMVPCWICTRYEPAKHDQWIDAGADFRTVAMLDDGSEVDLAIDLMKPISFDADWFRSTSTRAARCGRIEPVAAASCLAQQAVVMSYVSLEIRALDEGR
jgi:hypothetical protein